MTVLRQWFPVDLRQHSFVVPGSFLTAFRPLTRALSADLHQDLPGDYPGLLETLTQQVVSVRALPQFRFPWLLEVECCLLLQCLYNSKRTGHRKCLGHRVRSGYCDFVLLLVCA